MNLNSAKMRERRIHIVLLLLFFLGIGTSWIFHSPESRQIHAGEPGLRNIELQMSSSAFLKLKAARDAALLKGVLITGAEDWINCTLAEEKNKIPAFHFFVDNSYWFVTSFY